MKELSLYKDVTHSACLVCAWKSTSHVEIISTTFRAYVNLIFICINFLLLMYKVCALFSWHSSLNLLNNSVSNCLLVQCHILEQLFFSHTGAKETFRSSQLFWKVSIEKYFFCFGLWLIKFLSEQKIEFCSPGAWGNLLF